MPRRNTLVRSMHDLGIAAWFGGSLMGAIGLNGAAATAESPSERLAISARGWAKWTPVQIAAIVVHGVGGLGLIAGNKTRLIGQQESRTNTIVKTVVTALAGASVVGSAVTGATISKRAAEGGRGVTEPGDDTSPELARAQRVQKVLQWTTPLLTAVIIVLGAQQGEQQRPIKGLWETTLRNLRK